MDAYTPIKGKCMWWREIMVEEDAHDIMIKREDKRVRATCFVEGYDWLYTKKEIPSDCPKTRQCRYYIRSD